MQTQRLVSSNFLALVIRNASEQQVDRRFQDFPHWVLRVPDWDPNPTAADTAVVVGKAIPSASDLYLYEVEPIAFE